MAYWSAEKLEARLPDLIRGYDQSKIDAASYTLSLGPEAFVTSDHEAITALTDIKKRLARKDPIVIPPGQFAFLITEESVSIPNDAIAFISMKAKFKFKGLINVSGFHVDPGWKGRLVFSVYNAGPAPVYFSRGDDVFLIFYADLDRETEHVYTGKSKEQDSLHTDLLNGMTGQVFSPIALNREMGNIKKKNEVLQRELIELQSRYSFDSKLVRFFISASVLLFLKQFVDFGKIVQYFTGS